MIPSFKSLPSFFLGLALTVFFSANSAAVEVSVQNNSSVAAKLYSNDGSGWNLEGLIPSKSAPQRITVSPGSAWGFSNPSSSTVDIVKQVTISSFGFNTLKLSDSDLSGGSGLFGRKLTVRNNASRAVEVYSNTGSVWKFKQTVLTGAGPKQLPVNIGDEWGIDDPTKPGINIIKSITISNFDLFPSLIVEDRDFAPAAPTGKPLTVTNNCSRSLRLFSDDGSGPKLEDSIGSRAAPRTYSAKPGDRWGFDDPGVAGTLLVNPVTIRNFGTNNLTVTDSDFSGVVSPDDRTVTLNNNTSGSITVYSNNGGGWTREGTIGSRGSVPFSGKVGDVWGFSNPTTSVPDIIKQITIKRFGFNSLSISDADLTGGGSPDDRTVTVVNNTLGPVKVFTQNAVGGGPPWNNVGTVNASDTKPFTGKVGEIWGIDDPTGSSVAIIKQITVKSFGFNTLSVNPRDIPPTVPPGPPAGGDVKVTFKNNSSLQSYIYESFGLFNNTLLDTVDPGRSIDLNLRPGTSIKIKQDTPRSIAKYTIPTRDITYKIY